MNAFEILKTRLTAESDLSANLCYSMVIAIRWISLRIDMCSNILIAICLFMPLFFMDSV